MLAPAIEPRPRFWHWWVAFGVIAAGLAGIVDAVSGHPSLAFNLVSYAITGGAVWLGPVHASRRRTYDQRLRPALAAARARTDAARSAALSAAIAEATRPGRRAPANPLRPIVRAPEPRPRGVTPMEAEALAAQWMRLLGVVDAEPRRHSGDGGVDVVSTTYIAQVKNLAPTASVPVAQIRELAGVAAHDGRRALFFSSGGYSTGGIEFANRAGITLFVYDAVRGTLLGTNELGRVAVARGLSEPHPMR